MQQTSLFDLPLAPPRFDGATYDPAKDQQRLGGQMKAVFELMSDGKYRTLAQITDYLWDRHKLRASEAGVSARLRDLRKERFGSHVVNRRRRNNESALYEYQLEKTI